MRPACFEPPPLEAYGLLDSGAGEKLERFGEVLLRRPDPQALWRRRRDESAWSRADLAFVRESDRGGRWEARPGAHPAARGDAPEWTVEIDGGRFLVRPTPFKHVGLFPEQAANWRWVGERRERLDGAEPRLLNLFAYTGVASVLAARAGYRVTHVDASRAALDWACENERLSGLEPGTLRPVLDDALGFARREARRGARYAGILVDPPHHGRGPKGETWQLEQGLLPLLEACGQLLEERSFLVLSIYAVGTSPLALGNLLELLEGGTSDVAELALPEELPGPGLEPRLLPCGFCARWSRGLD